MTNTLHHDSNAIMKTDTSYVSQWMFGHLLHLKNVFGRCHKFEISLNPKKYICIVTKGKLLGCIISKSGNIVENATWKT